MIRQKGKHMGRLSVELELVNHQDVLFAQAGLLASGKVRRVRIQGVVDTGATRLVVPASVARQLGFPSAGKTKVRFADQRRVTRQVVSDVELEMLGRKSTFSAIVEPKRQDVLIGAIVLEELDFVVDCITRKLHPRDPDWILSEIE